jgi:dipeptide/tripeptide permease
MNIIQYGAYVAILIRILSTIIIVFQLIPLQIKEANVKNGLRKLRLQLLIVGITLFITNVVSIGLIADSIMDIVPASIFNALLQILNSLAILIFSIVLYLIYHNQYTPEAKKVHTEVDRQEKITERKNSV